MAISKCKLGHAQFQLQTPATEGKSPPHEEYKHHPTATLREASFFTPLSCAASAISSMSSASPATALMKATLACSGEEVGKA